MPSLHYKSAQNRRQSILTPLPGSGKNHQIAHFLLESDMAGNILMVRASQLTLELAERPVGSVTDAWMSVRGF